MPSAGVSTLRCLVVDDHPVVRQGIRALLERELDGVEVSTAATPEAALQESAEHPDVVVIDLRRVSGDVQDAVPKLQETLQSPIVVFTADGGERMMADALKASEKGYVCKDSPPEDLVQAQCGHSYSGRCHWHTVWAYRVTSDWWRVTNH